MSKNIIIKGAKVNILKNIDVTIPRDKLVVLTGLSGSGKSSLAFDTLYAEGHRRFVESLSSYARMFLGQMDKPEVDLIEGLSPSISIDQKTTSKNPRSTVGTVTEIYDYLRLLYARVGIPHCPVCGKEIRQQTQDQIVDRILALGDGTRFMVLAPVVRAQKGMHEKVFSDARKSGFARVRVDGNMYDLSEEIKLDKNIKHTIDIVVDRLVIKEDVRSRLSDSVDSALKAADGRVSIVTVPREGDGEEFEFSQKYACEEHGISFPELEPRMFSFNNPIGACPECAGIGNKQRISVKKLLPHMHLTLRDGAIAANGFKTLTEDSWTGPLIAAVGKDYGFTLDTPLKDFSLEAIRVLMHGAGDKEYTVTRYFGGEGRQHTTTYDGIVNIIEKRMKMQGGDYYQEFVEEVACPRCQGRRLSDMVLGVTVGGLNIDEICRLSIEKMLEFVENLRLGVSEAKIAKERNIRLYAMTNTGGRTWDIGVIPYVPTPYQWLKRYKAMLECQKLYGLCGTMDSHHYGWTPSYISDFAKWVFEDPNCDPEDILRRLAARDFSQEAVPTVLKAWQIFSDAIDTMPAVNKDQYGAFRVGPSYPFLLHKKGFVFDSPKEARFGGNRICFPMYEYNMNYEENKVKYDNETAMQTRSAALWMEGAKVLESALPMVAEEKRPAAEKEVGLAWFIHHCVVTQVNLRKWYELKQQLIKADKASQKEIATKMIALAQQEIENAGKKPVLH